MKNIKIFSILLSFTLLLASCGLNTDEVNQEEKTTLSIVGSTSIGPLMEEIASAYEKEFLDVSIEIQQVGSTAGIEATIDGSAHIGMSSRNLKDSEIDRGLTSMVIAYDGIAVIVNPKNSIKGLTIDDLKKIYIGEINNWKALGGADAPITVISREEGSGTRGTFDEIVKLLEDKKSLVSKEAEFASSNGEVRTKVSTNENAIGYISLGVADESVRVLSLDDILPTQTTIKELSYPISRPLLTVTLGEPKGVAKNFLDFATSNEGQSIVAKEFIRID